MKKLLLPAFVAVIIGTVWLANEEPVQQEASTSGKSTPPAVAKSPSQVPAAGSGKTTGAVKQGSSAQTSVATAALVATTTPASTKTPTLPGKLPRIEDFDPEKALSSGVWFHPDLPEDQVRAKMVEHLTNKALAEKRRADNWAKEVGMPIREELADGGFREIVRLEPDGTPTYVRTQNVKSAKTLQTDLVLDVVPYSVNGTRTSTSRFNIGEWDVSPARSTHKSLTGRLTKKDTTTLIDHATHVAGTLIANNVDPKVKGMAPTASLISYDWTNHFAEMAAEAQNTAIVGTKILVSNHSYGIGTGWEGSEYNGVWPEREDRKFGMYDGDSVLLDSVCANYPYYLPFFAAGNERDVQAPAEGETFRRFTKTSSGTVMKNHSVAYSAAIHPGADFQKGGYDTIPTFNGAKNVVTVGAVTDAVNAFGSRILNFATISDFSSWGPTDDGRIKPDIVAVGVNVLSTSAAGDDKTTTMSGTSMASPAACGSALLLQELYSDKFNGAAMRASTLKGLIIHTADDLGNAGPDYSYGWGLMNTKAAAEVIVAHKDAPTNNHLIEDQLSTAQSSKSYSFSWDGSNPIRVTVCWTDPAGPARSGLNNTAANLVNDLDLRITGPSGTSTPYILDPANPGSLATTGDNVRDNVEQVYIATPAIGLYTVTVNHKGTLNGNRAQNFSLIHTGLRSDAPVIKLSQSRFVLTAIPSSSPGFQTFTVQNTGGRPLNFSVVDDASWLHVNPASGSLAANQTETIHLGFTTTQMTSGSYTGRVRVTGPGAAPVELVVLLGILGNTVPLAQAIDTSETLTSSGSAPWYGQTYITHDSADAARSAPVKDSQDTAFSMTVQGPGELKFWWKVSSEDFDRLKFEIGTTVNQEISGNRDWAQVTVPIPTGTQKLTWRYKKDGSTAALEDAGWVDEVRYTRYSAILGLSQDRVDLVTVAGQNPPSFSFDVLNQGSGTASYTVKSSKSWVTVTPTSGSTAGEPDTIDVSINASTLKPGSTSAYVTVQPVNGVAREFDIKLTVLPNTGIPLHTAVDHGTPTSWATAAAPVGLSWFGQAVDAFDKTDCARSGNDVPDNGSSSMILAGLPGPCTVSFYWRTDCEAGWDKLIFLDGDTEVASISGQDPVWKQVSYFVPANSGAHTLSWTYRKDSGQSRGLDCGFVDKVVLDFKAPKLQVSTSSLVGSGIAGGAPGGPSFQISNVGSGTLNYAITADQIWCKPSVAKGTATTEIDTINLSFDARSLSAGTHRANLTVNGGVAGTHTISVELSLGGGLFTPVNVPTNHLQSFAKTTLPGAPEGWGFYSSDEGRIAIVSGALRMDDWLSGYNHSLNEAILHANLTGKTGLYLTFKYRQSEDESNILPANFTNHYNGDGVSISEDGVTWHTVDQLLNADGNFTTRVVNLDDAVAAAGISYNADFQIKFQQYDDCPWGTDGAEFDDVMLTTVPVADDHASAFILATTVAPGSSVNGKIEVAGDQDMFRIDVPQQTAMTLFTTGATDTYADLYDAGGNLIASYNDGIGKNFSISRTLGPGTFYVSVRGFNNAKGLYTFVTTSRVSSTLPSLTLPADDWTPLTYTPFAPTDPGVSYGVTTYGLLKQGQGETLVVVGSMNVKVTGNRSFTGKVFWDGVSYPVTGTFPITMGTVSGTVVRKGLSNLNYTLDYVNEGVVHSEWRLQGVVTDGITTANADLLEDYNWDALNHVGTYSVVIPAVDNGSTLEPQGAAFGTLTVTATGDATLSMTLPDETAFIVPVPLTSQHGGEPEISFYVPFGTGFCAGELRFRDLTDVSDLDGRVSWRKPANSKNAFYPSGFQLNRRILGSRFAPIANLPDLQLSGTTSAIAKFYGSELFYVPGGPRLVSWDLKDKLSSVFNGETWTYTYTPAKAMVSGTYKHPATATTGNFGGVIFQKQRRVIGFLKGRIQTGLFYMEP